MVNTYHIDRLVPNYIDVSVSTQKEKLLLSKQPAYIYNHSHL